MLTRLLAALSLVLFAFPAAAAEYLFDSDGDSHTITFGGFGGDPVMDIEGLSAELQLTLVSGIGTDSLTFAYILNNTSTSGGDSSRVSGFAFDMDPLATGGSASGDFTQIHFDRNYPNAIGNVDACLSNSGACSGPGGATLSDAATGTFTLDFDSNIGSLALSDFYVRYQSLSGLDGITSASGGEMNGVPEPATWVMLLLGFFLIGGVLRSRRPRHIGWSARLQSYS